MKKFCFWTITTIIYEVFIVGLGSYWLGTRLGNSFLDMKK